MATVVYHPDSSGIVALLQSGQMRSHMAGVGGDAASVARASAPRAAMEVDTTFAFGRWCVNITNTAKDALRQEYGGRNTAPLAPLGRALNAIRAADPNSRRALRRL